MITQLEDTTVGDVEEVRDHFDGVTQAIASLLPF
jgi:hypothetical protein